MSEMKDSGIEWIGEIPADWTLQRGKTIFAQRLTKGNQSELLLAATQKYGMLPQSEVEGVVQVKEDADLQQFRTVHKKDFVISLRSFKAALSIHSMREYVPLHIRCFTIQLQFAIIIIGFCLSLMVLFKK